MGWRFVGGVALASGWLALSASAVAGDTDVVRAEARPGGVTVVIEGPAADAPPKGGPYEVSVRIFEAEDPDAPPQVSTIAMKSINVDRLDAPVTTEIEVPPQRLAGALRPAVGVIVTSGGNMIYWTDTFVPLARSSPTAVRLAPVP